MLEVFEPQVVGCRCRQCRYSKTVTTTGGLGQWPHSWKKEMISKTTFPNDVKFPSVLFTLNMFPSCSIPIFLAETPPCVFHNCVLLGPSPPTKMNINCQGVRISRGFLHEIGTLRFSRKVSIGGLFLWFLSSVLNFADSKFNTLPAENHPICNNYCR